MTFRDVAIKNFKFNIRKYKAYILSCSFSVMIFFMYLTLFFNKGVVEKFKGTFIHDIMTAVLLVIIFYSAFFINYAQASFFKSRKKEFGLFLTLGMVKKDINKIIGIENLFIAVSSIIIGTISGTLFSRVFFMLSVKVLDSKEIKFDFSYKSFALSALTFVCIFLISAIVTLIRTSRLSISQLFIDARKSQESRAKNPVIGLIGLIVLVLSYILMYYYIRGKIFKYNESSGVVFILILSFVGIYILISQFGSLIIDFVKKNKAAYYKNIISITEVNYKFYEYKKILYLICILSALTVFFIGSTYGTYASNLKTVMEQNPYDVMYIETYNQNKLSKDQVEGILNKSDTKVKERKTLNFADLSLKKDNSIWGNVSVVSDKELNKISEVKVHVKKGYAIAGNGSAQTKKWCEGVKRLQLSKDEDSKYTEFKLQQEINKCFVNNNNATYCFMIILNNEDYKNLISKVDTKNLKKYYMFNFENWRKTKSVSENLTSKLKQVDGISSKKSNMELGEYWELYPASKIEDYNTLKTQSSFMLFVMCCIGMIFFISSGVILYFKIYTDIEAGKERYNKLYRIGIMDDEMKKSISKELKLIFFVPVFMGSAAGYLYIGIILSISSYYKNIMLNALIPIAIYFIFQTIFYNITRGKYIRETIK